MSLVPHVTLQAYDKWDVDFVGPINPTGKSKGVRYIITAIDYLTKWVEAARVRDYTVVIVSNFLFENVVTRFGC